jgi:hypothetical protein
MNKLNPPHHSRMDSREADMARMETAFATVVRTPESAAAANVAANRGDPYNTSAPTAPFDHQFYASCLWGGEGMDCPACSLAQMLTDTLGCPSDR